MIITPEELQKLQEQWMIEGAREQRNTDTWNKNTERRIKHEIKEDRKNRKKKK